MIRLTQTLFIGLAVSSLACASSIYDTTVLGNNPVAFLPLNETSGTTANNLANPAENGTYHNVTLGVPGGPDGTGAGFVPIGDFVSVPNYSAIDVVTAFTIEAWVNVNSAGANALGGVFAINRATSATGIALWLNGDHPELGLNNGSNFAELSTGTVTNGAWNQVAVSWDKTVNGGAPQFYINGVLVGNTDANGFANNLALTSTPGITIGAEFSNLLTASGRWFNGGIEDVSFYNTALSGTQIAADFASAQSQVPEPTTYLMIAGGLGCFAFIRRCKQAK